MTRAGAIAGDLLLKPSASVRAQRWDGVLVLVSPETGSRHRLNPVAERTWELLDGKRTLQDVAVALGQEFDAPLDRILADALNLAGELVEAGLLDPVTPGCPVAGRRAGTGPIVPAGTEAVGAGAGAVGAGAGAVGAGAGAVGAGELLVQRLEFEITHRCNLRCRHCFLQDAEPAPELSPAETLRVLTDIGQAGCGVVNFTGGEATLRPDLPDLITAAAQMGLRPTLITNGTTMTRALADRLAGAGCASVEVSIHGATAATHDAFTGLPGSFTQATEALGRLGGAGLPTKVIFVVTQFNYHEYRRAVFEIGPLTGDLGFSPLLYPTLRGSSVPLALRLDDGQLTQLMQDGLFRPTRRVCSLARGEGRVGPDGTLYPCGFVTQPLGNLVQTPFRDLWFSAACEELRQADWIRGTPPACAGCDRRHLCPRCPGLSYLESGQKMLPHEESCRITRLYREAVES
jgi:radical SAM protein with 4Fe4S-binding SPASM domain